MYSRPAGDRNKLEKTNRFVKMHMYQGRRQNRPEIDFSVFGFLMIRFDSLNNSALYNCFQEMSDLHKPNHASGLTRNYSECYNPEANQNEPPRSYPGRPNPTTKRIFPAVSYSVRPPAHRTDLYYSSVSLSDTTSTLHDQKNSRTNSTMTGSSTTHHEAVMRPISFRTINAVWTFATRYSIHVIRIVTHPVTRRIGIICL